MEKKTHKLSLKNKSEICYLFENGISIKEISEYFKIHRCNVHRLVTENNIQRKFSEKDRLKMEITKLREMQKQSL